LVLKFVQNIAEVLVFENQVSEIYALHKFAATYTTHNKHKRRTCMPSDGFVPSISSIKRVQYQALDCTIIEIGSLSTCMEICLVEPLD